MIKLENQSYCVHKTLVNFGERIDPKKKKTFGESQETLDEVILHI